MEEMKQTGIQWIGEIPSTWNTKRIKYIATLKGRIGWQGLTSEEYQDEGAYLITGVDFADGGIDWENCVHVPMKRWEEAADIQIADGDLLITKDGTIGKVAIVTNMPGETSLNSGVLRIVPVEGYSRRFLYWALKSDEFWNWFNYKNAGNSTIVHLYQGDFAEFLYAFPDFAEQEAIADFLDAHCAELDGIIRVLESQIEKLRIYRKHLISEAVTKGINRTVTMKHSGSDWIGSVPAHWDLTRFKYVATVKSNLVDVANYQHYLQVSPENIEKDTSRLFECVTVEEAGVTSGNHLFYEGQILYSKVRPKLNKVTIAPFSGLCSADMYPIETTQDTRFFVFAIKN